MTFMDDTGQADSLQRWRQVPTAAAFFTAVQAREHRIAGEWPNEGMRMRQLAAATLCALADRALS